MEENLPLLNVHVAIVVDNSVSLEFGRSMILTVFICAIPYSEQRVKGSSFHCKVLALHGSGWAMACLMWTGSVASQQADPRVGVCNCPATPRLRAFMRVTPLQLSNIVTFSLMTINPSSTTSILSCICYTAHLSQFHPPLSR